MGKEPFEATFGSHRVRTSARRGQTRVAPPDSGTVRDAAGTGQLFECVHMPGITDVREGMNAFL